MLCARKAHLADDRLHACACQTSRFLRRDVWITQPAGAGRLHSSIAGAGACSTLANVSSASRRDVSSAAYPRKMQSRARPCPGPRALQFATCGFIHGVGRDVAVTVGRSALLSVRRGYADPAPEAVQRPAFISREVS
jgi:hypothetical protein